MLRLLKTTFIKDSRIKLIIMFGLFADIITSKSIRHILILFGLPYLTSITLGYLVPVKRVRIKRRVSDQYRPVKSK
jgi:hypothetical protein